MINEIKSFEERKKELVKLGKEKGFITYEQLAHQLKGLDLDSDSLDELYNVFNENNIAVKSINLFIIFSIFATKVKILFQFHKFDECYNPIAIYKNSGAIF